MYRLYKKNELNFSLVWIISYVVLFSVADSFSASLGTEKIIAAPVAIVFTLLLLVFVSKHNLKEKYGLCSFNGSLRNFLYFTPLLLIMSILDSDGTIRADCITIPNNMDGFKQLLQTIRDCTKKSDKIKVGLEVYIGQ